MTNLDQFLNIVGTQAVRKCEQCRVRLVDNPASLEEDQLLQCRSVGFVDVASDPGCQKWFLSEDREIWINAGWPDRT